MTEVDRKLIAEKEIGNKIVRNYEVLEKCASCEYTNKFVDRETELKSVD